MDEEMSVGLFIDKAWLSNSKENNGSRYVRIGLIWATYTMLSSLFIENSLYVCTVKEEISRFSSHYNVRISVHPNELIASLTEPPIQRRLRRYWPNDLVVRF
jgi:hypothetical protein